MDLAAEELAAECEPGGLGGGEGCGERFAGEEGGKEMSERGFAAVEEGGELVG